MGLLLGCGERFPFLFGGTFIEGNTITGDLAMGLVFPFLFGGTFIEGFWRLCRSMMSAGFPFLFGGTFIEGLKNPLNGSSDKQISLPFRRDFH